MRYQIVLEGPGGVLDVKYANTPEEIKLAVLQIAQETVFELGDQIVVEENRDEAPN